MERAVLDQLADYFNTRLAGYATTLSEDDSLVIWALFNLWTVEAYVWLIDLLVIYL